MSNRAMRITRRGLFATIAVAVIGNPTVKVSPAALVPSWDPVFCNCTDCQYVRGVLGRPTYEFYPVALTMKVDDTITVQKPLRALINPES